ncbi:phosphopantetheine-binding protein [Streptomyces sp. NPDC057638]|uniref:phosphopantetheine-binding protein n=1 Tax=Streptomyces sp. NPDC057638 TaxID=3346190 RepID=UPI003686146B
MDIRFTELLTPFLTYLGEDELTPDADLRALGLDSMRSIELLFGIEDTFEISLADEDLNDATFATAGTLWDAIEAARTADGRAGVS